MKKWHILPESRWEGRCHNGGFLLQVWGHAGPASELFPGKLTLGFQQVQVSYSFSVAHPPWARILIVIFAIYFFLYQNESWFKQKTYKRMAYFKRQRLRAKWTCICILAPSSCETLSLSLNFSVLVSQPQQWRSDAPLTVLSEGVGAVQCAGMMLDWHTVWLSIGGL